MKTLVISDLHLTEKFNQKVYDILIELLNKVDRVIINGDFWEKDHTNFDGFVNSKWKSLFPLLKAKRTTYLFGNHDESETCDDRTNLFSIEQLEWKEVTLDEGTKLEIYSKNKLKDIYDIKSKTVMRFNHGQGVVPFENKFHELLDKNILFKPLRPIIRLVFDIRIFFMKENHYNLFKKMNNRMKLWTKNNLSENEILVCGHSHLQEVDLEEKFIDLGCFEKGQMQYMIIAEGSFKP
jgi:predicted phosphodiesterase